MPLFRKLNSLINLAKDLSMKDLSMANSVAYSEIVLEEQLIVRGREGHGKRRCVGGGIPPPTAGETFEI